MDNCFVDVTTEFLCVVFHNILYYTRIYPQSIFDSRRKYSIVTYRSMHPEINQYIDLCLNNIAECLRSAQLNRVEFVIMDNAYKLLMKFVFQFDKNDYFDETVDAYLIQMEQNLRAFCLKLSSMSGMFKNLPEDATFTVYMHTNESTAVSIAANPDFEDFPLVEVAENQAEIDTIIPMRRFTLRTHNIDSFIELKLLNL